MESLIAFLLDNIFIVIVAVGFLMSLFGKGRQKGGRMPDFGGGPMQGSPTRRQAPRLDQPTVSAPEAGKSSGQQSVFDADRERRDRSSAASSAVHSVSAGEGEAGGEGRWGTEGYGLDRPSRPQAPAAIRTAVSRADAVPRTPGADELRQAVLWAEILGPPRARKPHGRNSR